MRRNVYLATVMLLSGLLPGTSRGDAPEGLSGKVVDASGAGVEGARVWASSGRWDEPRTAATATTDGQGAFRMPDLWKSTAGEDGTKVSYAYLFAQGRDGRVGWRGPVHRNDGEPPKIVLRDAVDAQVRLIDQDGRPIAGAELAPTWLTEVTELPGMGFQGVPSPEVATLFQSRSGPDGSATIRGLPAKTRLSVKVRAAGFGEQRASWDLSAPVTIALDSRLGRIEGKLRAPDTRGLRGQLTMELRSETGNGELNPPPGKSVTWNYRRTNAAADGTFRFDEVPPGPYSITPSFGAGAPFAANPVTTRLEPGAKVAAVEIPLERLLTITGRVVDATSGEGLDGVSLTSYLLERNTLNYVAPARTDAQGRYTISARPGTMLVTTGTVPKTHLGMGTDEAPREKIEADATWPDLKLTRAAELEGIVLDDAGKPVAASRVTLVRPGVMSFNDGPVVSTGNDGKFYLEGLDPTDTLPVRARTDDASTDGAIVIRPDEQKGKGPLELRVSPRFAFKVKGLVADAAGKPLAGARVTVWWSRRYVTRKGRYQSMGLSSGLETVTTDSSGSYVSKALFPGDSYHVTVEHPRYSKAESSSVKGKSGEVHDFGTLRLISSAGTIAGTARSTDGKPIADVDVFNRGDGLQPVSTRTDAAGRFRLDGLYPGVKYAFARKVGYRFAGVRVGGDATDATITLRRADESPPEWKPGVTASFEDQRAFAKRALTQVWERFGKVGDIGNSGAFVCLLDMARIDPELALKWSAEHGHRYDNRIRRAEAEELADDDAQEALAILNGIPGDQSQYTLQQLAERFAETDREKALLFAEEAAVQARALNQPDRCRAMAEAGALLVRLGRVEPGRKLIDEAAVNALQLGDVGMPGYSRASVARTVAPFDLDLALKLIEPLKEPNEHDRYAGFVALGLAGKDPARAVAMSDAMEGNSFMPETVRTEVAYRIGAERTDEAIKVIEGMKRNSADKHRAEAFAWLAVAVARHDRERAFALIDRALSLPIDRPDTFESWSYFGGGMASAGWVALCARRIGYPDMESVIMRVLAARSAGRNIHDPSMQIESSATAATILALIAPAAARDVLMQVEQRSGLERAELQRIAGRHWLEAWALCDLEHAERLLQAELDALVARRAKEPDLNLQMTGLFKMAEILATPPDRREASLHDDLGAEWYPGARH
jgi:hypothetical protein